MLIAPGRAQDAVAMAREREFAGTLRLAVREMADVVVAAAAGAAGMPSHALIQLSRDVERASAEAAASLGRERHPEIDALRAHVRRVVAAWQAALRRARRTH